MDHFTGGTGSRSHRWWQRELKIITVPFDPRLRIFDDEALCSYLKGREVLRDEPELITHEGTAL